CASLSGADFGFALPTTICASGAEVSWREALITLGPPANAGVAKRAAASTITTTASRNDRRDRVMKPPVLDVQEEGGNCTKYQEPDTKRPEIFLAADERGSRKPSPRSRSAWSS